MHRETLLPTAKSHTSRSLTRRKNIHYPSHKSVSRWHFFLALYDPPCQSSAEHCCHCLCIPMRCTFPNMPSSSSPLVLADKVLRVWLHMPEPEQTVCVSALDLNLWCQSSAITGIDSQQNCSDSLWKNTVRHVTLGSRLGSLSWSVWLVLKPLKDYHLLFNRSQGVDQKRVCRHQLYIRRNQPADCHGFVVCGIQSNHRTLHWIRYVRTCSHLAPPPASPLKPETR